MKLNHSSSKLFRKGLLKLNLALLCVGLAMLVFNSCVSIKQYSGLAEKSPTIDFLGKYLSENKDAPEDPDIYSSGNSSSKRNIELSDPWWLIPSTLLPKDVISQQSNNNVSITVFNHRFYIAFRTSKTHFASANTHLYVMSTADGRTWQKELDIFSDQDAREPFLININDTLRFYYFTAGTKMMKFEPGGIWLYELPRAGQWNHVGQIRPGAEVHWSIKNRRGKTYLTSYSGSHYQLKGDATVQLNFRTTQNAKDWSAVADSSMVYFGGVSEADFEFDRKGNLWAIGRLEDGDNTGFGSHIFYAEADSLGVWQHKDTADIRSFMSPRMFRHGDDIFVIARKQLGRKEFGHANRNKSMKKQRLRNWISYSLSPKTTALYQLDKASKTLVWVMDLPGAGDTAFPSIIRLNEHQFMVANYTSPPHKSGISWLKGQLNKTMIYLQVISFVE